MIETNTTNLKGGIGKMAKLNAVCRSYARHKLDEQRALRAKRCLAMVEGDEIDLQVAECRLEQFEQETQPVIDRMHKALRPISQNKVELRNLNVLSDWW